jgi:hypothetical protein
VQPIVNTNKFPHMGEGSSLGGIPVIFSVVFASAAVHSEGFLVFPNLWQCISI